MSHLPVSRSHRRALTLIAGALYCLVLVVASFEHHDVLCHLQNPQHCTACTATPLGSDPQTLVPPPAAELADAGTTVALVVIAQDALLSPRSTGRSPPSSI